MSDRYFSIVFGNHRALCISPLTDDELAAEGKDANGGLGYYLYERDFVDGGVVILAEVGSEDSALTLYRTLAGAIAPLDIAA